MNSEEEEEEEGRERVEDAEKELKKMEVGRGER